MSSGHRTPAMRVTMDGADLTDRISPRLLDLTITEQRGDEADQLDVRLHDHDGRITLPRRGAVLNVALGWRDTGLTDKGEYIVDEVEYSGAPDVIALRARSADFRAALRIRKERSFDSVTLGAIIRTLAGEHGLTPRIGPALDAIPIAHIDQTESDANLLARLGESHDAVATIKRGRLLFMPVGAGTTADGKTLPTVSIARADGDGFRYHSADRNAYSGVRAEWHDKDVAQKQTVLAGKGDNAKVLKETFASEADALAEARAEWGRIQRGKATLSYTLAHGRPGIYPEQTASLRGFKRELDETPWLIVKVVHSLGDGGFSTAIDMETGADGESDG